MNDFATMPIRDVYRQVRQLKDNGIDGYHIENKYEDPEKILKSKMGKKSQSHKNFTKRGNYLEDETRNKKHIPGPGNYKIKG